MTTSPTPPPDWAAALAGRYAVDGVLGAGGMAVVYAARDLRHGGRRVAIKVVTDPEHGLLLARFAREVEFAAQLQHPNIVPLYESGVAAGVPYYVMPLVEGHSLADRLARDGPLPVAEATRVVTDVARALGHAHARGVVHRDVKPGNVLLSGGVAVVTDFGIARAMYAARAGAGPGGRARPLTRVGASLGTPEYMSPEQATGSADVDARADVYSLACVAFELLTGRPPYGGASAGSASASAVIAGHLTAPVPSARAINPAVPSAVDLVLRRGLAKDPDARFQTAESFAAALAEAAAGAPRLTSAGLSRAALPQRRRAWAAAAAGLLLTASAVGWNVWRREAARPPVIAVLRFDARGPGADQDFVDGLTDEITARFAALPGVGVVSRASVLRYDAVGKSIAQIGRDLGVDYVLTGAVRFEPQADGSTTLRVLPRLARARDDRELWSQALDSSLRPGALLAAQATVADSVASQLDLTVAPAEAVAHGGAPTESPAAYAFYLRGLAARARRYDAAAAPRAVELFRRAVEADTGFALAYARLADAEVFAYRTADPAPERVAAARAALARAVSLDSTLPEARVAHAWLTYTAGVARPEENAAIRRDIEYARRTRPNDPEVLWLLGNVARRGGRWNEALATYAEAAHRSPRDELFPIELAATYICLRRYDDAEAWIARTAALGPSYPVVELHRTAIFTMQGDVAAARRALDDGVRRFGSAGMLRALVPRFHTTIVQVGGPLLDSLRALRLGQLPIDTATYYLAHADAAAAARDGSARAYYDSALTVYARRPTGVDPASLMRRAYALAGAGQAAAALRAADSALALQPPERDAWEGTNLLENALRVAVRARAWPLAHARATALLGRPAQFTGGLFRIDPAFAAARARPEFADVVVAP